MTLHNLETQRQLQRRPQSSVSALSESLSFFKTKRRLLHWRVWNRLGRPRRVSRRVLSNWTRSHFPWLPIRNPFPKTRSGFSNSSVKSWVKVGKSCISSFIESILSLTVGWYCIMTRIKVLKDEIRKPYFLKLKQFLWDEGVRTSSDTPATVKIFPPREFLPISSLWSSRLSENKTFSTKHLYLVEHALRDDKGCNIGPRSVYLYTLAFQEAQPLPPNLIDPYIGAGQAHGEVFFHLLQDHTFNE